MREPSHDDSPGEREAVSIQNAAPISPEGLCEGCAFRIGTPANQSPITASDAQYCASPGEAPFFCHADETMDAGRPTKPCPGWVLARMQDAASNRGYRADEVAAAASIMLIECIGMATDDPDIAKDTLVKTCADMHEKMRREWSRLQFMRRAALETGSGLQ
jgi:hypothetical protein